MPANAFVFLELLDSAVSGKFIYAIFATIMGIDTDSGGRLGQTEQKIALEKAKLVSVSLTDNVGGYVIIYILTALILCFLLVAKLSSKKSERLQFFFIWLKKQLMYNFFIRLMLQTDLKMLHMAVAYFTLDQAFRKDGLSFLMSLVIIAYLILPFFIFVAVMHFHYMELFP